MSASQQAYISKVHLKGYKSIRDLEIDFKPGLNIIIGPNGSGKTNFVKMLSAKVNDDLRDDFFCEIIYNKNDDLITKKTERIEELNNELVEVKLKNSILKGNDLIEESYSIYDNRLGDYRVNYTKNDVEVIHFNYSHILFSDSHNLSLNNNLKIELFKFNNSNKLYLKFKEPKPHYLIENLFKHQLNNNDFQTNFDLEKFMIINSTVIENLSSYTSIKKLKVVNTDSKNDNQTYPISERQYNAKIQYFVNNTWLDWHQLSDGTIKMFYIILFVLLEKVNTIFLEEPELGIHPDQLYKLMDFIKEQSKEKQIIITTHSPDVLNTLGKDELDRIVVTRYDEEKGTQMHKLSPQQIKKGQRYMEKVGHLSDYWVHSNLEEYEIEE